MLFRLVTKRQQEPAQRVIIATGFLIRLMRPCDPRLTVAVILTAKSSGSRLIRLLVQITNLRYDTIRHGMGIDGRWSLINWLSFTRILDLGIVEDW